MFPRSEIRYVKLHPHALMPTRTHDDDAGYDLYVSELVVIGPGEFLDIPTGIAMQLPAGAWGMLTGRSSTLRKRGLLVNQGIIDTGYRGELFAGVWNLTLGQAVVQRGERLAQIIVMPNATIDTYVVEVNMLAESSRGIQGFGSSGN